MKAEMTGVAAAISILIAILALRANKPRPVEKLPEPSPEVHELIQGGLKIDAIKLYRKETHTSLLEASRVIEFYSEQSSPAA